MKSGYNFLSGIVAITLLAISAIFFLKPDQVPSSTDGKVPFFRQTKIESGTTTLLFVGDMFFDRYIRKMSRKYGEDKLFACADTVLRKADMVVGNLEGPITDSQSVSEDTVIGSPDNYRFTFPSTTAALLLRHNIRVVHLGNNHIANFGNEGIDSTHQYLEEAGVKYFGGVSGDESVYEMVAHGNPIAFVSYNAFLGSSSTTVAALITGEHEKGNTVIVFAHWGNEYSTSTRDLKEIAQLFVASGARLIVGSHPHVVLPHETIDGVPVYYSLGNFIFDQYWDRAVSHGLVLEITLTQKTIHVREHTAEILRNGRTCIQ